MTTHNLVDTKSNISTDIILVKPGINSLNQMLIGTVRGGHFITFHKRNKKKENSF